MTKLRSVWEKIKDFRRKCIKSYPSMSSIEAMVIEKFKSIWKKLEYFRRKVKIFFWRVRDWLLSFLKSLWWVELILVLVFVSILSFIPIFFHFRLCGVQFFEWKVELMLNHINGRNNDLSLGCKNHFMGFILSFTLFLGTMFIVWKVIEVDTMRKLKIIWKAIKPFRRKVRFLWWRVSSWILLVVKPLGRIALAFLIITIYVISLFPIPFHLHVCTSTFDHLVLMWVTSQLNTYLSELQLECEKPLRNLTLSIGLAVATTLAIWRGIVATMQSRVALRGINDQRFQFAVKMLDSDSVEVRRRGIGALHELAEQNAQRYIVDVCNLLNDVLRPSKSNRYSMVARRTNVELRDAAQAVVILKSRHPARARKVKINFSNIDLSGIRLEPWILPNGARGLLDLSNSNMINAKLNSVRMRRAILSNSKLTGASLNVARLYRVNLKGADMRWADLTGARLDKANLTSAKLKYANLKMTKFRGAKLDNAKLCMVDLSDADLTDASLVGADLTGANLSRADLTGTDLSGVKLKDAHVRCAIVKGAIGLTQDELDKVSIEDLHEIPYNMAKEDLPDFGGLKCAKTKRVLNWNKLKDKLH